MKYEETGGIKSLNDSLKVIQSVNNRPGIWTQVSLTPKARLFKTTPLGKATMSPRGNLSMILYPSQIQIVINMEFFWTVYEIWMEGPFKSKKSHVFAVGQVRQRWTLTKGASFFHTEMSETHLIKTVSLGPSLKNHRKVNRACIQCPRMLPTNALTILSLSFVFFKMGILRVPSSQGCSVLKIKWDNLHKSSLPLCLGHSRCLINMIPSVLGNAYLDLLLIKSSQIYCSMFWSKTSQSGTPSLNALICFKQIISWGVEREMHK